MRVIVSREKRKALAEAAKQLVAFFFKKCRSPPVIDETTTVARVSQQSQK
jgi:hypothetical protein